MTTLELYLITRLDDIRSLLEAPGLIALLLAAITLLGIALLICNTTDDKPSDNIIRIINKALKITTCIFIFSITVLPTIKAFIPSTKDIAVIIAGKYATNSEEMKKLPDNVLKTFNTFLEKYNKPEGNNQ